jgi:hypothetical protein
MSSIVRNTLVILVLGVLCATTAVAANLSTGFGGPPGGAASGVMFDITVGAQDLLMTQIGANMQADPGVSVYIRPGTHVGNEFSPVGWTEILNDAALVGNGNGVETGLDVSDFVLSASQTYGIAIFVPDRLETAAGTGLGSVAASNADLSILEGIVHGGGYGVDEFGSGFSLGPFVVETTIYYEAAAQPVPIPRTLAPLLGASLIGTGLWARRRLATA